MSRFLSYPFSRDTEKGQLQPLTKENTKQNRNLTERDKRVLSNLKLAVGIAQEFKKRSGTPMHIEDLVQFANMGLCFASDNFDETKGCAFSTYATNWVKKYVLHAIEYISPVLKVNRDDVNNDAHHAANQYIVYGDESQNSSSEDSQRSTVFDSIICMDSNHDEKTDLHKQKEYQFNVISGILDELTDKERKITCCYFGLPPFESENSTKEVSAKLKIDKSTVEKILEKSISKMKNYTSTVEIDADFLLKTASILSKYKNDVSDKDYIKSEDIFLQKQKYKLDKDIIAIGEISGLTERQVFNAIYFDDEHEYNFFAKREILGLTVFKKFTIERRFMNRRSGGTAKISVSYSAFDKTGKCVINNKHSHNELGVSMRTIQEWLIWYGVNQMHSPQYSTFCL